MANNVIANITATFISGLASEFVRQPSGGFNGSHRYLQCSFTRRQKHAHLSPNSVRRVKSCRILCGLNIIDQSSHISSCVGSFVEHRTTCVNRTKDPPLRASGWSDESFSELAASMRPGFRMVGRLADSGVDKKRFSDWRSPPRSTRVTPSFNFFY